MPAPENRLKARLRNGDRTTGLWLSLTSSYVAELAGHIGFDWLLVDGEHAPNDLTSIMQQLQVLRSSSSPVIVRPPIGEVHLIKQYLDMGVQSFLIPMIESREQAELMVKAVRYPLFRQYWRLHPYGQRPDLPDAAGRKPGSDHRTR
jgi:4-hydroxy-2-oxoheptanedioate aldolase